MDAVEAGEPCTRAVRARTIAAVPPATQSIQFVIGPTPLHLTQVTTRRIRDCAHATQPIQAATDAISMSPGSVATFVIDQWIDQGNPTHATSTRGVASNSASERIAAAESRILRFMVVAEQSRQSISVGRVYCDTQGVID